MSSEEVLGLKPLGMPLRAAAVAEKPDVLKLYLESKNPVFLDYGELSAEKIASAAVSVLKEAQRLSKLSQVLSVIAIEIYSNTDNPNLDGITIEIARYKGEITAACITAAMEKARLSLHMIGRRMFSQYTTLNILAFVQPGSSSNFKSVDFNMNAHMTELSFLATPLSNHAPTMDIGKEALNGLALVNVKKTCEAIECLSMMSATYLYILTHFLTLHTIHHTFLAHAVPAILSITTNLFNSILLDEHGLLPDYELLSTLSNRILEHVVAQLPLTTSQDPAVRWNNITVTASGVVVTFFCSHVGRVTEGYDVLGPVDRWIGVMGDTLGKLDRRAGRVGDRDVEAVVGEVSGKMYHFVRKGLEVGFDKSGKEDVGKCVGAIFDAIKAGRFEEVYG